MKKMIYVSLVFMMSLSSICNAETLHFKGKGYHADKKGNTVCRVYINKNEQGQIASIEGHGYFQEIFNGDQNDVHVGWNSEKVYLVTLDGAVEPASCSSWMNPFNCFEFDENHLLLESSRKYPSEDIMIKDKTRLNIKLDNGNPVDFELNIKRKESFLVFSEERDMTLNCRNLKLVEVRK